MTLGDAYTRTLCSNRFAENTFNPSRLPLVRYEYAKRRLYQLYCATRLGSHEASEASMYDRTKDAVLLNRITSEGLGRQLLWTEDGAPGLGPLDALPGDQIWAVLGSRELLVVRPVLSDTSAFSSQAIPLAYQVGGGCSLCGYFEGEAVLGPVPDNMRILKHRAGAMIFENTETGEQSFLDPRLSSLGIDLTAFLSKLEQQKHGDALDDFHPWLEVTDIDYLRARLASIGVKLQDLHLV
jgi:hypothetical protein